MDEQKICSTENENDNEYQNEATHTPTTPPFDESLLSIISALGAGECGFVT